MLARRKLITPLRWAPIVAVLAVGLLVRLATFPLYGPAVFNFYGGDSTRYLRLKFTGFEGLFGDPLWPAGYRLLVHHSGLVGLATAHDWRAACLRSHHRRRPLPHIAQRWLNTLVGFGPCGGCRVKRRPGVPRARHPDRERVDRAACGGVRSVCGGIGRLRPSSQVVDLRRGDDRSLGNRSWSVASTSTGACGVGAVHGAIASPAGRGGRRGAPFSRICPGPLRSCRHLRGRRLRRTGRQQRVLLVRPRGTVR